MAYYSAAYLRIFVLQEINDIICSTLGNPGIAHSDAFAVVLMSHGSRGVVYGSDGQKVDLDSFLNLLDTNQCPALENSPKLPSSRRAKHV